MVTLLLQDPRTQDGLKLFTVPELDWFSKNAYNLGIKYAPEWSLDCTIKMCNACVSIAQKYPKDLPRHEACDISLRSMFCYFVIATAHIALARSEDNIETQLQHYLSSRTHINSFEAQLREVVHDDDKCSDDLELKFATLLVFDFESAVNLKAWDELTTIARKAAVHKDLKVLQAIADSLLRAQAPIKGMH